MTPMLASDYCVRCMEPFHSGQALMLVSGGPKAKYRGVGTTICADCLQTGGFDQVDGLSIYFSKGPLPLDDPETIKPRFVSDRPIEGFIKLSLLDNHLWRIGFHRNHPEIWTAAEVGDLGRWAAENVSGQRYSRDYQLFGPATVVTAPDAHAVVRVEFLDLRAYVEGRRPKRG